MPSVIDPLALTFFRFSGGLMLFWLISLVLKPEKVSTKDKLLLGVASIFALILNQIPFFSGAINYGDDVIAG